MEKKYKALRIIGSIYKILGIIVSVITILVIIGICATSFLGGAALENFSRELGDYGYSGSAGVFGGLLGGFLLSIFAIINGGIIALSLFGIGEGIYVFISIEENTRTTAELLKTSIKIDNSASN